MKKVLLIFSFVFNTAFCANYDNVDKLLNHLSVGTQEFNQNKKKKTAFRISAILEILTTTYQIETSHILQYLNSKNSNSPLVEYLIKTHSYKNQPVTLRDRNGTIGIIKTVLEKTIKWKEDGKPEHKKENIKDYIALFIRANSMLERARCSLTNEELRALGEKNHTMFKKLLRFHTEHLGNT